MTNNFIPVDEVRGLLLELEAARENWDDAPFGSTFHEEQAEEALRDRAEELAEKLDWVYSREPEHAEDGVHEGQWWEVHPAEGGIAAVCHFELNYDEAEDFARAILRAVEDGRKKGEA